jgi:hypothetical protein
VKNNRRDVLKKCGEVIRRRKLRARSSVQPHPIKYQRKSRAPNLISQTPTSERVTRLTWLEVNVTPLSRVREQLITRNDVPIRARVTSKVGSLKPSPSFPTKKPSGTQYLHQPNALMTNQNRSAQGNNPPRAISLLRCKKFHPRSPTAIKNKVTPVCTQWLVKHRLRVGGHQQLQWQATNDNRF